MIQKTKQVWFEVWGNEVAQNQFLKYLLIVLGFLNFVLMVSVTILALRTPPIFAVSSIDTGRLRANPPPKEYLENEAKRIITAYLQSRHNWDAGTIQTSIGTASRYVDDSFRKSFLQANEIQIRIALEKKIAQKFYVSRVDLDLTKGVAAVSGDRILAVDGFRAASSLAFNIAFRLGARTEQNPEGVYITSEQLIEQGKEPR